MANALTEIVHDYRAKYQRRARIELEYFRRQPTFRDAISEAALARFRGKKLSHQWRVPTAALEESRQRLLANAATLREMSSFDELFDAVEAMVGSIPGIGELTVYDTVLRIGGYLGLAPDRVYLHAGTRKGAQRLGLKASGRTLEMNSLPRPLQGLTAREAEDVLCIYKDAFTDSSKTRDVRANCHRRTQEIVSIASRC